MKVNIQGEDSVEIKDGSTVEDIIDRLDYHLDSVIVIHDGTPMPLDKTLEDDQELKIISVVSGG